jgi:general secretion pathway protein F
MPRYSYKAYDQSGALLSGAIDVATREAALQALSARGQMAVEVFETGESATLPWWQREVFAAKRLSDGERLVLTRELATLIKAELPLDEALGIVVLMPGLGARVRALAVRILDRVREGESLSQALSGQGNAFPEFYWRLVRAGESGGSLGDVMGELSTLLERSSDMRSRVASAMLYPMLLMAAAFAAVLVIMLVLLPAVMPLFAEAGVEPPLVLRMMSSVHAAVTEHWQASGLVLGILVLAALVLRNDAGFRAARDKLALRLPAIGRLTTMRETGRFCRTMSALLKNGVPLLDALRSTAGVLTNRVYVDATGALAGAVAEGATLSQQMQASKLFSELSVRLAAAGEKTGHIDGMLARAATIHEAMLERDVDRITKLIGPVLTLFIGLFTGGLILSVMQAILSINDLALR